jgi:hypothetical protein
MIAAACCGAVPARAQWGFTATLRSSGECSAYVGSMSLPSITGFSTKAECEAVRAQISGIRFSVPECSIYYNCSACSGSDIAGAAGGNTGGNTGGSANLNGTNQGAPFYTTNSYEAIRDAYDQKKLQNEKHGTNTRNIPFDNARAQLLRRGSGAGEHSTFYTTKYGVGGSISREGVGSASGYVDTRALNQVVNSARADRAREAQAKKNHQANLNEINEAKKDIEAELNDANSQLTREEKEEVKKELDELVKQIPPTTPPPPQPKAQQPSSQTKPSTQPNAQPQREEASQKKDCNYQCLQGTSKNTLSNFTALVEKVKKAKEAKKQE